MRSARLLAALLVLATATATAVAAKPPNILLVMVDDMGYGDPGCYNPESKIPTPNVDRLAREGMRFTDAHASGPLCHVSRYGLMTGRAPFRTNVGVWSRQPVIDEGRMTIASLLRDNGYQTSMVGKWHLGFAENGYDKPLPGGPVDRGFQRYFGIRASTDIPPYFYIRDRMAVQPPTNRIAANNTKGWSPIQGAFWRAGGIAPNLALKDVLPRFTEEAVDEIDRLVKEPKPFFLYLAYPAPHTPWLPDEEFVGRSKAGLYGDFAVMVDAMVGRVLKKLDEAGVADETLVIFTSDNGPCWYESDDERFGHDSSGGLRGMKADAWEGGHRMPFVVRWPGRVKAGSTSKQMLSFTDLLATFAAVVEAELPREAGPDSFDMLPVLLGDRDENEPVRLSLVVKSGRLYSVRMGPWKLIDGLGSGGFTKPSFVKPGPGDPKGQLYRLDKDLGETKNVYDQYPEVVERLTAELERIKSSGRSRP